MSTCSVCTRAPSAEGLCTYHLTARRNLQAGFRLWQEAYGGMNFKDYLGRVLELPETGAWVREVAGAELETRSEEN